jgi:DNA-binding NarL/FixJ family response regulator
MVIYTAKETIGVDMMLIQESIRVLIVDDAPQVRQELATMLCLATRNMRPKIEVIGEAQDGTEAVALSERLHPDVVLMDLEMPVLNGYCATRSIKSKHPSTFIIILTIHDDLISRQNAVIAGADAFIEKSAPLEKLIQAILGLKKANLYREIL